MEMKALIGERFLIPQFNPRWEAKYFSHIGTELSNPSVRSHDNFNESGTCEMLVFDWIRYDQK
jgi:hypothetical protein